ALLQLLLALPHRFAREMEPELQNQRALVRQHLLEAVDLGDAAIELAPLPLLLHGGARDRIGVPAAEEDADLPAGRQDAPETPEARMLQLLLGRLAEAVHLDVARIQPRRQRVD